MPRQRLRSFLPFGVLAAVAVAFVLFLILSERIPSSADQATVGLMARHILAGRGHPVFYWGSTYGGTFEPHVVAAAFALFGDTMRVFRFAMAGLFAVFAFGLLAVSARFFGRAVALTAAAYLALPPFFFPYKTLTSDGAYATVALLALAVVGICLSAWEKPAGGRSIAAHMAALGLVTGVGIWVTPVTLPVAGIGFLWLFFHRAAGGRLPSLAAWGAGIAAGSAPWWLWNARHGWASLHSHEIEAAAGGGLLANVHGFFSASLPVLLGAARTNFRDDPHASFPGALVVIPVLVALLLVPAVLAARSDARVRLLFLALTAQAAAMIVAARFSPSEPRYLVATYALLPILLGLAFERLPHGLSRALWFGGFAVLLASDVSNGVHAHRHLEDRDDSQVTAPIGPLLESLRAVNASRAWANYGTASRITFESNGEIVATPIVREDGLRDARADELVRAAPRPAIVLLPPRDGCLRAYLAEERLAFQEAHAGFFTIFFDLPDVLRDQVRTAGTLPMPRDAYRVSWSAPDIPVSAAPGAGLTGRARVTNVGSCTWMHGVRLLADWKGPEALEETAPTPNRRVAPGETADLAFRLRAPETSGDYELRLDLEQQGITRFSAKGGATLDARVVVVR
ncbi:MAG: hypothetical protein ABI584_10955 [Acidobacteriota bacterium]